VEKMNEVDRNADEEISLAECAQLLSIPYQDAHRLLLLGQLSGVKRGGRWVCSRASVKRLLCAREVARVTGAAS
jgi:hypothetical protein